jgi:hypothetical protein
VFEVVAHSLEVHRTGLLVPLHVVDGTVAVGELTRVHVCVPDQHQSGLPVEATKQLVQRDLIEETGVGVHPLVDAVVEVDVIESLEMPRTVRR